MTKTEIQLTEEDAKAFIKFQKHYALIMALDDLGAFEVLNGSVEIHFDDHGRVGLINIHRHFRPPKVGDK